ncbi:MAG TPA: SAM-dependent methyltransferase [Planctomycetaceae bacterium]|nr:SAM-dependent methyltransferase [Planctomycetaceae bacterium]
MARRRPHHRRSRPERTVRHEIRIVGGEHRSRRLVYQLEPGTRPMKNRTREAIFNLLGRPDRDVWGLDLFAGTGAMAFEALSRGAGAALCVERHRPTAKQIVAAAERLGLADRLQVVAQDVFRWWDLMGDSPSLPQDRPWWVFCCPPYRLLHEAPERIDELLRQLKQRLPPASWLVLEADEAFSSDRLPPGDWDRRAYPPAVVYLCRKD